MDSELKICTNPTNIVFIILGLLPPPQPCSSTSSQLLCRVRWKWSEGSETSSRITGSPSSDGSRDRLGVSLCVICFWFICFCILFSVCIKQDLEKKENTTHHLIFIFLTKTWGEETTRLHNCLSHKVIIFHTADVKPDDKQLMASTDQNVYPFSSSSPGGKSFSHYCHDDDQTDPKLIRCQHFSKKK